MSTVTLTHPRRPALQLPADLCVGLVSAAGGLWVLGSTWGGPFAARVAAAIVGGALVLVGAWWTAGGVRGAR